MTVDEIVVQHGGFLSLIPLHKQTYMIAPRSISAQSVNENGYDYNNEAIYATGEEALRVNKYNSG